MNIHQRSGVLEEWLLVPCVQRKLRRVWKLRSPKPLSLSVLKPS